jgi:hypothetical protein
MFRLFMLLLFCLNTFGQDIITFNATENELYSLNFVQGVSYGSNSQILELDSYYLFLPFTYDKIVIGSNDKENQPSRFTYEIPNPIIESYLRKLANLGSNQSNFLSFLTNFVANDPYQMIEYVTPYLNLSGQKEIYFEKYSSNSLFMADANSIIHVYSGTTTPLPDRSWPGSVIGVNNHLSTGLVLINSIERDYLHYYKVFDGLTDVNSVSPSGMRIAFVKTNTGIRQEYNEVLDGLFNLENLPNIITADLYSWIFR